MSYITRIDGEKSDIKLEIPSDPLANIKFIGGYIKLLRNFYPDEPVRFHILEVTEEGWRVIQDINVPTKAQKEISGEFGTYVPLFFKEEEK